MREHLYCGKRVDNGEWVEGFYAEPTRHWHKYGIHKAWIITGAFQNGGVFNVMGRHAVLPETVSEYTGLTDKNGKKIFEGYIVKYIDGKLYEVVFKNKNGCAFFGVRAIGEETVFKFDLITRAEECEIIGNIHDNPELLEGK